MISGFSPVEIAIGKSGVLTKKMKNIINFKVTYKASNSESFFPISDATNEGRSTDIRKDAREGPRPSLLGLNELVGTSHQAMP